MRERTRARAHLPLKATKRDEPPIHSGRSKFARAYTLRPPSAHANVADFPDRLRADVPNLINYVAGALHFTARARESCRLRAAGCVCDRAKCQDAAQRSCKVFSLRARLRTLWQHQHTIGMMQI